MDLLKVKLEPQPMAGYRLLPEAAIYMSDELQLSLLGKVVIKRNGALVTGFRSRAAPALLVYLAYTGQSHSREVLADLLWEARSTRQSLSNLRTVLTLLHQHVGDYVLIARDTVEFNKDLAYRLDTTELQFQLTALLKTPSAHGAQVGLSPAAAAQLQQALRLYEGDFMAGFHLRDAPRFNEWVVVEQERLRRLVIDGHRQLATFYLTQGDCRAGIETATRWLSLEPFDESAHGQMMQLLARAGQRSAALAQYEACCRILREELGVEPDAATTSLYERIRSGELDAERVAPVPVKLSAAMLPPHNLPAHAQPTPFIGRETELALLNNLLAHPQGRLVTITGLGGMGKTRLALAAAEQQLQSPLAPAGSEHRLPDGVYFVALAPLNSARQIIPTLAKALNFPLAPCPDVRQPDSSPCSPEQQLFDYLRPQRLLLVMDNMEHLAEGGRELLAGLLHEAPGVHILATSQEPLRLPEEQVCSVQGLDCPDWETQAAVAAAVAAPEGNTTGYADAVECLAEEHPAFRLFLASARRVQPGFSFKADDLVSLARICHLVMGMPLGIELAAAWVDTLSLDDIADQIQTSLDFLETELRNMPDRHRSLRAVFDAAWQRLSPIERAVFAQLSVFRGSFRRAAVQAVSGDCLPVMATLVKKSLLLYNRANGRYQIHELLRQYAADKLAQDPSMKAAALDRHGAYYCVMLRNHAAHLLGDGQVVALATIEADINNVRQAWEWAVTQTRLDLVENGRQGLWQFYLLKGHFQEGEAAFGRAADYVRVLCTDAGPSRDRQVLLGELLVAQARFLNRLDQYPQAIAAAQAAVELAQASEAPHVEAGGNLAWGEALLLQGRYEAAHLRLQQALSQARSSHSRWVEADSLVSLGRYSSEQCDYAQAQASLEAAWQIHSQIGNRAGEVVTLTSLGILVHNQGQHTKAGAYFEQALSIARETGNRHDQGRLLGWLGRVAEGKGDYGKALTCYSEALRIAEEIHDRRGEGYVLHNLGVVSARTGKYSQARDYYEQSLRANREIGDRHAEAQVLADLGSLYNLLNEPEVALAYHQQMLHVGQEVGARTVVRVAWVRLGQDWEELDNLAEARHAYQQALSLRCELEPTEFSKINVRIGQ